MWVGEMCPCVRITSETIARRWCDRAGIPFLGRADILARCGGSLLRAARSRRDHRFAIKADRPRRILDPVLLYAARENCRDCVDVLLAAGAATGALAAIRVPWVAVAVAVLAAMVFSGRAKGRDGAYASGSHATGIVDILTPIFTEITERKRGEREVNEAKGFAEPIELAMKHVLA